MPLPHSRKLPSIHALQCFESSARHLSFTQAAKELHLTQSAVSKQVAQLEELLGVPLFYRINQGIVLSAMGQGYYLDVLQILQQLESANITLITKQNETETLHIFSHPTFCAKWLIPALKGFSGVHPKIHLHITEQANPLLNTQAIEMAFLFGDGVWVDMEAVKLFDEHCIAVCSPTYLSDKILGLTTLAEYPLLQLNSRPSAWYDYFAQQNHSLTKSVMGANFDTFYACINAAQIGCGIALVPERFVQRELANGTLVIAHPYRIKSHSSYYLAYQSRLKHTPKIQAMLKWVAQHSLQ
ncbi:MAG: LysR substrate-binding domain-containing protein [Moraxella sp.]|nr:LysR substrate-binding domain-containing protein [Moraxella sp.]